MDTDKQAQDMPDPSTLAIVHKRLADELRMRKTWEWAHQFHANARAASERAYAESGGGVAVDRDVYHDAILMASYGEEAAAERSLLTTPVPDLAALAAKLEHMFHDDEADRGFEPEERQSVLSDVRRLIPNAGEPDALAH